MGEAPRFTVRRITGSGAADILVTAHVGFPSPVTAVLEVRKTVLIDRCDPTLESVLVQGRLHVCYVVAAGESETACERTSAPNPVLSMTAVTGFLVRVPVAGATPYQHTTPVDGHVTFDGSLIDRTDAVGRLCSVCDRSLVRISVRMSEEAEVESPSDPGVADAPPPPQLPPPRGCTVSHFRSRRR